MNQSKQESHVSDAQGTAYPADDTVLPNQVGTTTLNGVPIVSLFIDNKERLCLAQISNTLLKDFSYNEIHNRRVALGITCVQCTPVQLEILRRAGAMPISSRRCGMITKREAERLVKSFLEEHRPPKLPDNFAFRVKHTCGWGCYGQFVPARYNSSRAKCIKCNFCNVFFSPNKFIFHFHRMPDANYRHPDAANFNSWRRHLLLDYDQPSDDFTHAWEDVKAMFNGGSRKRTSSSLSGPYNEQDNAFIPKRQCYPAEADMMFNKKVVQSSPYPLLPISNMNTGNMIFPFPMSQSYPMIHSGDNKTFEDRAKCQTLDVWRNKPPATAMCHPLSLLWAKSFGMYPFHANANIPPSMNEWSRRMAISKQNNKPIGHGRNIGSERDDHFSAFKPVGMLGSRFFGETSMNTKPSPEETGTSRWLNIPKSSYNMCANAALETIPTSSDPERRDIIFPELLADDAQKEKLIQDIEEECPSSPESEVCIEDLPPLSMKEPAFPTQTSRGVEQEGGTNTERREDKTAPCPDTAPAPTADISESPAALVSSSIYEMSKEELQMELLRMMKRKDQEL